MGLALCEVEGTLTGACGSKAMRLRVIEMLVGIVAPNVAMWAVARYDWKGFSDGDVCANTHLCPAPLPAVNLAQ